MKICFDLDSRALISDLYTLGIIPGQSGILYLSQGCVFTSSSASDITFQSKIMVFDKFFQIFIIKHVQTHVNVLLGRKSYLLGGIDF